MQNAFFNDDELEQAKTAFAGAWYAERLASVFEPDPFKAALTIWNEENGMLPKALWIAHTARWQDDPDVIVMLREFEEEAKLEAEAEHLKEAAVIETDDFKQLVRFEMITELRQMLKNRFIDAKDRTGAMDRLSKLMGLDEKPAPVDPDGEGRVLGVIHHRLKPLNDDDFEKMARVQQGKLQNELIDLAATDAVTIN